MKTTTKIIQREFFLQKETFSRWIFIIVVKGLCLLKTNSAEAVIMVSKQRQFAMKPENLALVPGSYLMVGVALCPPHMRCNVCVCPSHNNINKSEYCNGKLFEVLQSGAL